MTGQRGFGLLEVLVGVGLLGFILGAFLTTLGTGFRATTTQDQQVTAGALARSQLESIRSADYFAPPSVPYLIPPGNDPGVYAVPAPNFTPPPQYSVVVEIAQYCDDVQCYPVDEIQQVSAAVSHDGKPVRQISVLKARR